MFRNSTSLFRRNPLLKHEFMEYFDRDDSIKAFLKKQSKKIERELLSADPDLELSDPNIFVDKIVDPSESAHHHKFIATPSSYTVKQITCTYNIIYANQPIAQLHIICLPPSTAESHHTYRFVVDDVVIDPQTYPTEAALVDDFVTNCVLHAKRLVAKSLPERDPRTLAGHTLRKAEDIAFDINILQRKLHGYVPDFRREEIQEEISKLTGKLESLIMSAEEELMYDAPKYRNPTGRGDALYEFIYEKERALAREKQMRSLEEDEPLRPSYGPPRRAKDLPVVRHLHAILSNLSKRVLLLQNAV